MSRLRAVALASLCAVVSAAHGIDGVIEINQARAIAGGVSAGDDPGFPVQIYAAGSYRLTGNVDVTGEKTPEGVTAILIAAANVSLDLNGFSIVGPVQCSGGPPPTSCTPSGNGIGIDAHNFPNTRVTNGFVRGFAIGIWTSLATLERVHLFSNRLGGLLISGTGPQLSQTHGGGSISNCLASFNGGTGFEGTSGAQGLRIESSRAFENAGHGFVLPIRSEIRSSEAHHNGGDGIIGGGGVAVGNLSTYNLGSQLTVDLCGSNVLIGTSKPTACFAQFEPNLCNGAICP